VPPGEPPPLAGVLDGEVAGSISGAQRGGTEELNKHPGSTSNENQLSPTLISGRTHLSTGLERGFTRT